MQIYVFFIENTSYEVNVHLQSDKQEKLSNVHLFSHHILFIYFSLTVQETDGPGNTYSVENMRQDIHVETKMTSHNPALHLE